jgi:hypothetical protein
MSSAYPFLAEAELGTRGVYLGTNLLTGGGSFAYDPFEAYRAGLITNPNMLFAGEPGVGKSATAKTFIFRTAGVFGRWVAIADPKAEYLGLADALGLTVIKLHPGGTSRLNPMDPGAFRRDETADEIARRQSEMLAALLASVLHRGLSPLEDAVLGWTVAHLGRRQRKNPPTLGDVAHAMAELPPDVIHRARLSNDELVRSVEPAVHALGKLLDRSLRGMFDGHTNIRLDWSGAGIVLDLSAVHHDPEALTLVMIATTAWLQAVLSHSQGPPRLQVLDEVWSLLATERTSRYLQSCWKLGRAYGVANLAIVHRLSDLRSQTDDGTAASKVSMGLLADTQTRVLFRQSTDQVAEARELLGLTSTEAALLPRLCKGRALWKIAGRAAVVQHIIGREEASLCETDTRMIAP